MGPAIFVPSVNSIPYAVKHIYTRMAANATTIDGGVADLLVSLVGDGSHLSQNSRNHLQIALKNLVRPVQMKKSALLLHKTEAYNFTAN